MSRLGIDRTTGLIYEGRTAATHPVWPTPLITQATLIETPNDLDKIPHSFDNNPFSWLFLESSFDSISRIRRGRLFQSFGNCDRQLMQVEAHPAMPSDIANVTSGSQRVRKELGLFIECTDLLAKEAHGEGMRLALGQKDAQSLWKILQTERTVFGDIVVTLRAESAYNILPTIDKSQILPESVKNVESAIERVLHAAYRELPTSVVDQCRNAAVVVISSWMQKHLNAESPLDYDLGKWIKAIEKTFEKEGGMVALCAALQVIARLHPRGKDNEAKKHNLRQVEEEDAEFALQALGFVIREVKWAA